MTPAQHITVLAGLAPSAAIDEKKVLVRLPRNTLKILQATEEILVQGLAGFNLHRTQGGAFLEQKIDFMPRIIAPEIGVRASAGDELQNGKLFFNVP